MTVMLVHICQALLVAHLSAKSLSAFSFGRELNAWAKLEDA